MNIEDVHFNLEDDPYGDYSVVIQCVPPDSNVSLDVPSNEDVVEIFGEGEDDYSDCGGGWYYGVLKDGRYFLYSEWADYTFAGCSLDLANSREDIERFGLNPEQRRKLGIVLEDIA